MLHSYNSLIEATYDLLKRGYATNFQFNGSQLLDPATGRTYAPSDLSLVEFHRFEGKAHPTDNSIILAFITDTGKKGILVAAYDLYMTRDLISFVNKVPMKRPSATSSENRQRQNQASN